MNSGICPRPYARMIGSAILKPSIHPGKGCVSADSMMLGRTIDSGRFSAAQSSSTARSPSAFVNVYTSGHPSERARCRPYSMRRLVTQSLRRCSASSATVRGPARECSFAAFAMNDSSCSGRRLAASTSPRAPSARSASRR